MASRSRFAAVALALVIAAAIGTAFLKPDEPPRLGNAPEPAAPQPLLANAASPADLLVRAHSPVLGANDAPITIVEVLDPSCEACKAWHPDVKKIAAEHPGKVRIVVRYALFHQGSDVAAALLQMANMQGKFEAALDALFQRQPEWAVHGKPDLALAARIVQSAGVDVSAQKQREALAAVQQNLQEDTKDVNALQVESTPTFYVNGRQLVTRTPQGLADAVTQALGALK